MQYNACPGSGDKVVDQESRRPPPLAVLGERIMVCGPSSNGKSTLSLALGKRIGADVVHLDALCHKPHTDWVQRPDEEFTRLHDEAIAGERWVIDGNYSRLMGKRLERATGIILLGAGRWSNLYRYLNRTLVQRRRAGHLEGAPERVKWSMIHWIMVTSPIRLADYRRTLPQSGLPLVEVRTLGELNRLYRDWQLSR